MTPAGDVRFLQSHSATGSGAEQLAVFLFFVALPPLDGMFGPKAHFVFLRNTMAARILPCLSLRNATPEPAVRWAPEVRQKGTMVGRCGGGLAATGPIGGETSVPAARMHGNDAWQHTHTLLRYG